MANAQKEIASLQETLAAERATLAALELLKTDLSGKVQTTEAERDAVRERIQAAEKEKQEAEAKVNTSIWFVKPS